MIEDLQVFDGIGGNEVIAYKIKSATHEKWPRYFFRFLGQVFMPLP